MINDDLSAADPLGQIADEFVEAFRQGKRPSVEEFARRYPEHAEQIRDLFPALVMMEQIAPVSECSPPPSAGAPCRRRSPPTALRRLSLHRASPPPR